jgi:dephospho-CoA kinase
MNHIIDQNGKCKDARPALVAVTGGIGSGKSMVCHHLAQKGLVVLSADELSRLAVEPGTIAHGKIIEYFGDRVLLPDKSINRPELRRIISVDPEAKQALESYIHPEVFRQMEEQINTAAKNCEPRVIVEVPLLFESGFDAWFDYVVFVSLDEEPRIKRLMARDGITREAAKAMMNIQMPESEKRKRSDFVVDNNGTREETLQSVDRLYEYLVANISKKNKNS